MNNKKINPWLIIGTLACVASVFLIGMLVYRKNAREAAPAPTSQSLASLVRDDSPSMGPADAKVTIVEFLDPECEACRAMAPIVNCSGMVISSPT